MFEIPFRHLKWYANLMENKELVEIPPERVANLIYLIRGHKVMLDRDLAELYGVETRILNQVVSRNIDRFPEDFMFRLNKELEFSKNTFL